MRVLIEGHWVHLAQPLTPPTCQFVGRETELTLCKAAWGVGDTGNGHAEDGLRSLHFRLQGPPGVGKNEIVYELARQLDRPLYMMQGHDELTPEDLALLLVPDPETSQMDSMPLVLRASPLATALYVGGLFFFDEINRVPEKALAPLSSVLDGRRTIFSAMTGLHIKSRDEQARQQFRFCCALNPELSDSGLVLPDYIEQRTLPVIEVDYPELEHLRDIIQQNLACSQAFLQAFERWYDDQPNKSISARQALTLLNFAMRYHSTYGGAEFSLLTKLKHHILWRH